jgi:hypothetical protein
MIIKSDINEKELEDISEIKTYFSRIFTVIPKEIKERLKTLNISKEKRKMLKKELVFLSKENQLKYLDELERLYD